MPFYKLVFLFTILLLVACQEQPAQITTSSPQTKKKVHSQPVALNPLATMTKSHPPITRDTAEPIQIPNTPAPHTEQKQTTAAFGKKYITGRFNQRKHPDFVRLNDKYCAYSDMYLRKEVYEAFLKMYKAAKNDGIHLKIRSATRNFYSQKRIWERKWTGKKLIVGGENLAKTTPNPVKRAKKILRYSSMPGSSRHHWGTDIDLNDLANSYFESGKGYKMYQWMLAHAHDFGFYQVYTEKGPKRPTGYNEERWHWTYLPTSKKILDEARSTLTDEDFYGFLGNKTAPQIHIMKNYVLGINPACL